MFCMVLMLFMFLLVIFVFVSMRCGMYLVDEGDSVE